MNTKSKTRQSITVPPELWQEVEEFRFAAKVPSLAEAVRRLLRDGLRGGTERAEIVAWLRRDDWFGFTAADLADSIEREEDKRGR